MAITLAVGPSTGANSGFSATITLTLLGVTAGQSIVVGAIWNDAGNSITSVTCTSESNLTLHTKVGSGSTVGAHQFASLASVTTSGDKTIVITWGSNHSPSEANAFAMSLSGTNTSSFFDTQANNSPAIVSATPSINITTTNDNALIVATIYSNGGTASPGSGYTAITTPHALKEGEYDLDAGSAGVKAVDFSLGSSNSSTILAAAFNPLPPGSEGTSEFDLPLFSVEADSGETLGTANLQLPLFDTMAEDGTHFDIPLFTTSGAGLTGEDGVSGSTTLPIFTMEAAGTPGESAVFDLPLFTVEADGLTAVAATLDRGLLPLFEVEATGVTEGLGTAAIELPLFETSAGNEAGAEFDLPLFETTAAGTGGVIADGDAELPLFSTSAAGDVVNILTAEFALPLFSVAASAVDSSVGTAAAELRLFTLEADGETGTAGTASISVPLFTPAAAGTTPSFGTGSASLPLFAVEAIGTPTFASTWRTWVLNLHTRALTEYTGFQFNSYARFAGYTLAASDGGVFKLDTTRNDAGTEIDAIVRTGQLDYDVSWLKRVPRLYIDYSTDGDVDVSTITSESGRRKYLLRHNNVTGIQQRRVPVGKGPKSRHWQFEVANRNGSDFSLGSIIAYPTVLGRRAQ